MAGGDAVGTGHLAGLPVDGEVGLGETAAVLGLPAGGSEDRAHQIDTVIPAGSDHFPGCRVTGVDQVPIGQEVALGKVSVDRGDQPHVLDGGVGRGHVRDQVRAVRLTGLGEMDLVAVPEDAPLHAAPRVGVVGRDQPLRARRAVLEVAASDLPVVDEVLLDPHLPQRLDPVEQPQGRRGIRGVQGRKQPQPVGPDLLDQLRLLRLPLGQAGVLEPDRIPAEPVGRNPAGQPLRLAGSHAVQRGPQGLTEPHQPIDLPGRGQDDRRVRASTPARLEQAALRGGPKDPVQELDPNASRDQPVPELGEHRVVETCIGQLQPQQVLPVQPPAHRVRGLPVRQTLGELHDRHQRQPARRPRRLPSARIEVSEVLVSEQLAQFVPDPHGQAALRERGPCHPGRLLRHPADLPRVQRHRHPPQTQRRPSRPQRVMKADVTLAHDSPTVSFQCRGRTFQGAGQASQPMEST